MLNPKNGQVLSAEIMGDGHKDHGYEFVQLSGNYFIAGESYTGTSLHLLFAKVIG